MRTATNCISSRISGRCRLIRAYLESALRSQEQNQVRIEEAKRAYHEAMKKLEKDLARQKQNQAK